MTETPAADRWPRPDPRDPGVPPDRQDRTVHPLPPPPVGPWFTLLADLTSLRDLVYNR